MLLVMDLAIVISEYIGEHSQEIMPPKVEETKSGFVEEVKEAMKVAGAVSLPYLPNVARKLVLRF